MEFRGSGTCWGTTAKLWPLRPIREMYTHGAPRCRRTRGTHLDQACWPRSLRPHVRWLRNSACAEAYLSVSVERLDEVLRFGRTARLARYSPSPTTEYAARASMRHDFVRSISISIEGRSSSPSKLRSPNFPSPERTSGQRSWIISPGNALPMPPFAEGAASRRKSPNQ